MSAITAKNGLSSTVQGGSVPNPDPTERTVEQLLREIATSREVVEAKSAGGVHVLETRLAGMDTAIELLQKASDKIPAYIRDQVANLEHLHSEKFASVATQFLERDNRTQQLGMADKTAIAAALQAQKEQAGATAEMMLSAINKIEANFGKMIEQTQGLVSVGMRNLDDKITMVTARVDRGEGRGSGEKEAQVVHQTSSRDTVAWAVAAMAAMGFLIMLAEKIK